MSGVFIASLGHSGSTLLDLMLGSHPRLVSLGEVHADDRARGRAAEPVHLREAGRGVPDLGVQPWKRSGATPHRPYGELHALVLARVREVCGDGVAPVDSSKHVPALAALPGRAAPRAAPSSSS